MTALDRRGFLSRSLLALVPAGAVIQEESDAPRLYRPNFAGRPRERITNYENDPFIVGLEGQIRCTCGCNLDVYTCRTTDFSCSVSPAMHREVVALVEDGRTGEEILEAFIGKYGESVLMAPKKVGFNIAAYVVPGMAIVLAGALILWGLARRSRMLAAAPQSAPDVPDLPPEEAALLDEELAKLGR